MKIRAVPAKHGPVVAMAITGMSSECHRGTEEAAIRPPQGDGGSEFQATERYVNFPGRKDRRGFATTAIYVQSLGGVGEEVWVFVQVKRS